MRTVPNPSQQELVELSLVDTDGREWTVSFSAGVERFIGVYPRIDGLCAKGAILRYRPHFRA